MSKVLVINVQRAYGVSKKTGSEYDICSLTYGAPFKEQHGDTRTVTGSGWTPQEIALDPSVMSQFKDIKLPSELDLIVEADPRNLNRNICRGVKQ